MSDKLRAAALMAVDALDSDDPTIQLRAAMNLRAALAEPETNDYERGFDDGFILRKEKDGKRPCAGLTDDEINAIEFPESGTATMRDFVRIIEAKLREKNT
jgi:hypothetical protein